MELEDIRACIEQAAKSFDAELHTKACAELTSDAAQLHRLVSYLAPQEGQVLLDLGTGSGYVAMSLARQYPQSYIIGLDIAEEAISKDAEIAKQEGLSNVRFRTFDGVTLPFEDSYFHAAVCRYALHHFPRCAVTVGEIARTLRCKGNFILADAVRNDEDETDFINKFQGMKPDGHVRMYRSDGLIELLSCVGFELVHRFETSLSFGRRRSKEYDELLASTPERVQKSYHIVRSEEEIRLKLTILNAAFVNCRSDTMSAADA
jgi:ubiquinone/menaquinone biosynthesis C-methylase UbiE